MSEEQTSALEDTSINIDQKLIEEGTAQLTSEIEVLEAWLVELESSDGKDSEVIGGGFVGIGANLADGDDPKNDCFGAKPRYTDVFGPEPRRKVCCLSEIRLIPRTGESGLNPFSISWNFRLDELWWDG